MSISKIDIIFCVSTVYVVVSNSVEGLSWETWFWRFKCDLVCLGMSDCERVFSFLQILNLIHVLKGYWLKLYVLDLFLPTVPSDKVPFSCAYLNVFWKSLGQFVVVICIFFWTLSVLMSKIAERQISFILVYCDVSFAGGIYCKNHALLLLLLYYF